MASISLRDVSVQFPIYQGGSRSLKRALLRAGAGGRIARDDGNRIQVQALRNISLDIGHGDRIGLIGGNGAGKTTLLRILAGVYEPVSGDVQINGRVSPMFDVGLGLNPDATGYENIILRGLYMGMKPAEIAQHTEEVIAFTELGDYLSMPVRTYSAGMTLRLAFAVATCAQPEILLMDEWIVAGDSHFIHKAHSRLERFVNNSSVLVLASHTEPLLRQWCNKLILLEKGIVVKVGSPDEVLEAYHLSSQKD
jgi:ABC-2 type transport system ATP-binding protein